MTDIVKTTNIETGNAKVILNPVVPEDFHVLREVVAELEIKLVELDQRVNELEKKRYVRTKRR